MSSVSPRPCNRSSQPSTPHAHYILKFKTLNSIQTRKAVDTRLEKTSLNPKDLQIPLTRPGLAAFLTAFRSRFGLLARAVVAVLAISQRFLSGLLGLRGVRAMGLGVFGLEIRALGTLGLKANGFQRCWV